MDPSTLELLKELDPAALQKKFLQAIVQIQNVKRGSIWIRQQDHYTCIEAEGAESDQIKGVKLKTNQSSIVGWVIENGEMTIAETSSDSRHRKEVEKDFAVKSSLILCFPLLLKENKVYGAVQIIDTTPEKNRLNLDKEYLENIQNLVDICSIALGNAIVYSREKKRSEKLESALTRIRHENRMIGNSEALRESLELVKSYAPTDFHVLITGESGTGKELVAEQIHRMSIRKDKPFMVQNCSAIPETLLESELFGYKKGAFSGANRDKKGLFEAADGGTVFLDEIGDMPVNIQAGILRVLQKNEIKPLGETEVRYVDVRIISATNKDIKQMIAENTFRQDLFYRLSVLPVHLPPLRERKADIPLLVKHFIRREAANNALEEKRVSPLAMRFITAHSWPGNIRELENLIKYLMVTVDRDTIEPEDVPEQIRTRKPGGAQNGGDANAGGSAGVDFTAYTWQEMEKIYTETLLENNSWNITRAAEDADVNRSTFVSRMRRLGLRKISKN
ncbi:MAG: sigma-54-dependent Fis family transcriptional regulator [Desulfarculaceae bacterium]|nr:sigma-54-dependent Fis family transcriptional regulator [Desulfarculaceae bacterium]